MNYILKNKEAWEEAFDNRDASWGTDIVEKIKTEKFPFLEKPFLSSIEKLSLKGKTIGHFCCNNGRELLSLMQSGADEGIGFDIAENQVAFANSKAKELSLNCRFISANILDIGTEFYNRFDLIIITIGALCWFKDLKAFFEKVSLCLHDGGVLLINEQHPFTSMLSAPGEDNYNENFPANCVNSYFTKEWVNTGGMYYMTQKTYESKPFTDYTHSISDIMAGVCRNGMVITGFSEYDYDLSGMFSTLSHKGFPLSLLLEARKIKY